MRIIIPKDHPSYLLCPISCALMADPVVASDGITYERSLITQWLSKKDTSPITNLVLDSKVLVPNINIRQAIYDYCHTYGMDIPYVYTDEDSDSDLEKYHEEDIVSDISDEVDEVPVPQSPSQLLSLSPPLTLRELSFNLIANKLKQDNLPEILISELRHYSAGSIEFYFFHMGSPNKIATELYGWGDKSFIANTKRNETYVTTMGFQNYFGRHIQVI